MSTSHLYSTVKFLTEINPPRNFEHPESLDKLVPPRVRGVDFSDHWGFWQLGFQVIMVTDMAWYRNPNYHKAADAIDTLDFGKMEQVVQGLYCGVMGKG